MSFMVCDSTDDPGLAGVNNPFGKWGPFTKEEAEAFIASHPYPDALFVYPSAQCR
jgi:hypothetical protein